MTSQDPMPNDSPITRELLAARALIADPTAWCRDYMALTAEGDQAAGSDPLADRRCAIGALEAVVGEGNWRYAGGLKYLTAAAREVGYRHIVSLNNSTDHPTTLLAFDRAIELSREERRP